MGDYVLKLNVKYRITKKSNT